MAEASEALSALQKVAAAQTASVPRFNTELVRSAWNAVQRRRREARMAARRAQSDLGDMTAVAEDPLAYAWIEQLWTDHLIVKIEDGEQGYLRVPFSIKAPATSTDDVTFGAPEPVRVAFVAASALQRISDAAQSLELTKRVKTQAGVQKYRKPIGTILGDGTTGRVAEATGKEAVNRADALRKNIKDLAAKDKTYRGGKVFGDIGNEGKLKNALSSVSKLPDGKRGQAAAEIVLAAQALGLTRLVPASVKRLYREYLAQKPSDKKTETKDKKS